MSHPSQILIFLRILIMLMSGETAIRYILWWWETRKERNALLISLMLGIAVVHGTLAGMIGTDLLHVLHVGRSSASPILLSIFGTGIVAGTFFHLIPCWQLSCGLTRFWVWANLIARVVMAGALSYVLATFSLETWL